MALIGTISGSVGPGGTLSTTTAISGSLIIADEPPARFPALPAGAKLFVSGTKSSVGADAPSAIFGGDTFVSGALGTDSYLQMKPVNTLRIPTNTTASYIYTSGSTNDLYFTQYQPVTGYTNTTRLRWLESTIQTGLLHGGVISSASGSNTYSILSGSGLVLSFNASLASDPYPVITQVSWGNIVSSSLPSISTTQITYIGIDSTGTPYLKSTPFQDGEYAQYIVLGRVLHADKVGTNGAVNQPLVSYGSSQFRGDFVRAFGPIKLSGHTLYVSGTTGLKKDGGDSYAEGRNYTTDPNSPNYVSSTTDTAQNTSKIFYEYVNSSGDDVILNNGNAGYAAVDFANYNNAGVLTAVGAGNKFTIQRVFWFPNSVNRAFYVYYGNTIYSTIADAQAGIATEVFTEGKNTRDAAIFLGYLIVKGTLVDFTDPTTYKVIQAGSFRAVASAGAGATGTPGGATTQVQFNDAGVFNGTSDFTFVKGAGTVSMANLIVSGTSTGAIVSSGTLQVKDAGGNVVGSISSGGVISGSSDLQIGGNITGSNLLLTGDIAVVGGDLTTTTAAFNLVTGASTIRMGANPSTVILSGTLDASGSSGTTLVRAVGGDMSVASSTGRLLLGPTGQNQQIHNSSNYEMTNTAGHILLTNNALNQRIEVATTGSTSAGMFRVRRNTGFLPGGRIATDLFEVRNDGTVMIGSASSGPNFLGSTTIMNDLFLASGVVAVSTDTTPIQLVSSGNVTIKLDANNNAVGHFFAIQNFAGTNQLLVGENGNTEVSGTLVVSGNNISTVTTTTFNLLNNALTGTLNIGGATQTINFGSPTNTGSMQGDFTVGNRSTFGGIIERMVHTQGGSTLTCNMIGQSIFYLNGPSGAVTANFTNVPTTTDRIHTPTVIISQSATPQIVSIVQIDGVGQPINWSNGITPAGSAFKQDVFGFSLIRSGSGAGTAWKVLGQLSTYG